MPGCGRLRSMVAIVPERRTNLHGLACPHTDQVILPIQNLGCKLHKGALTGVVQ